MASKLRGGGMGKCKEAERRHDHTSVVDRSAAERPPIMQPCFALQRPSYLFGLAAECMPVHIHGRCLSAVEGASSPADELQWMAHSARCTALWVCHARAEHAKP